MVFDRKWFNMLYFKMIENIYEKDPELAREVDFNVIGGLGKRMAKEIKEQSPQVPNKMDYLLNALRESHWFQENVEVIEKSDREVILQTRNCSWQLPWMKKHQEIYPCINSHKAFLEEFSKEIDPKMRVENLLEPTKNPKDGIYCKWKIYK